MEPFEIRTVPARLSLMTVGSTLLLLPVTVYVVWLGGQTTLLAARGIPDDPGRLAGLAVLLLLAYAGTWVFLRMVAPMVQVVSMYLFRDRGKRVVAYRLDATGWHHVVAGSDVGVPWEGLTAAVTDRADGWFRLQVTSDGPYTAGRDPYSRQLRRTLRKERGFSIPMTNSDPTEDELASAIARQSAGRVELAR